MVAVVTVSSQYGTGAADATATMCDMLGCGVCLDSSNGLRHEDGQLLGPGLGVTPTARQNAPCPMR